LTTPSASDLPASVPITGTPTGAHRLQWLYLALAVMGAVLPWLANLEFIQHSDNAFDLGLFLHLANANPAAQSLSRDLFIGASAVTIWMVAEGRRLQVKGLGICLLCCVTLAFACGAPLFLFLRERRLQELERAGADNATD
jgi:hypothetical protein